ncbi:hypothetical protein A2841_03880 [Candidatus Kaiserbacteria bacterium RIFCSPHIGHO2_01_FULL_48_10]|uniref:Uncharacterized protein n=1 Tax=Candidatus Kaiserbacteria bacterium RIFCSPHIGHO2_01_FULL_48_10 TaxID=1798476 RepID=A0A1F6C2T7_9BACT|nr:MAG: hypothetical protein A2841_03880 [Candidatus Kaiserbacteria bacterium RIFCSPHIGHO2_01_FULL_48_10]
MKLLTRVPRIEVKRCFLISDDTKKHSLKEAKKKFLSMSEKKLDERIKKKSKKRLHDYNRLEWYIGVVNPHEVGVWRGAGGLPLSFTRESLKKTAMFVKSALRDASPLLKERAQTAIPGIMKNVTILGQKQKYLFPIIVSGPTFRRRGMKKMLGDIDDGCMRSIVLALKGKKFIRAYIGVEV